LRNQFFECVVRQARAVAHANSSELYESSIDEAMQAVATAPRIGSVPIDLAQAFK
jgi:hypothetical protein